MSTQSCVLSGFPIKHEGEKIKVIYLLKDKDDQHWGRGTAGYWFTPIGLPFDAGYDSYGRYFRVEDSYAWRYTNQRIAMLMGVEPEENLGEPYFDSFQEHDFAREKAEVVNFEGWGARQFAGKRLAVCYARKDV